MFLSLGVINARNMLSWLKLLIYYYCCMWLVVYIIVSAMHGHTNITALLHYTIISLASFELCRTREDKNEIRKLVYCHTCMKISFCISCCIVSRLHVSQQTLFQTSDKRYLCDKSYPSVSMLKQILINTNIFKCYGNWTTENV